MPPLEKQVCSLEYSKKLAELGVKRDSLFYYSPFLDEGREVHHELLFRDEIINLDEHHISAFTTAELGMMLPEYIIEHSKIDGDHYSLKIVSVLNNGSYKEVVMGFDDENQADLIAKALIYAIEFKLITVDEINERI